MFGRLLCKIGNHNWSKPKIHYIFDSNIKDIEKRCTRCGKTKKWIEPFK